MIEFLTRSINDNEKNKIQKERNILQKQKSKYLKFTVVLCLLGFVIGIPLAIGQLNKETGLGYLAFGVVGIYIAIFIWSYFSNIKDNNRRIKVLKSGIDNGEVKVIRCQSEKVVDMAEVEDEGVGYFFQVEENKIYYIGGQQYYSINKFPNSNFEIIEVWSKDKQPVWFDAYCNGEKLEPLRTIGKDMKEEMLNSGNYPQDGDLIDGNLDNIENIVLRILHEGN